MMKAGKLQEFKGILGYLVSSRPASDKFLPPNLRKRMGWWGGKGRKEKRKGRKKIKPFCLTPSLGENMWNSFEHYL